MQTFENFFNSKQTLLEYNDDEAKQILFILKNTYKNRRIILTHDEFEPKTLESKMQALRPKPRGTWYSLGEYWAAWLTSEMPHWWENYNHVYMLDIDYSKMLRINNEAKMIAFREKYEVDSYSINWERVAQDYSGIEIIPMVWGAINPLWYSTWDIPSGCIWNADAIKGVKKVIESDQPN
jgi:hypothetical protein